VDHRALRGVGRSGSNTSRYDEQRHGAQGPGICGRPSGDGRGLRELDALEIYDPVDDSIRIQPCHSPVWDTSISTYALLQCGFDRDGEPIRKAVNWMLAKEVKRPGDWQIKNPAPPGGWYFEFANEFYPDVDDTIMVMMALRWSARPGRARKSRTRSRAGSSGSGGCRMKTEAGPALTGTTTKRFSVKCLSPITTR